MPLPKLPPFEGLPKPPKLSQIILKKANPVREVIDDARQLIKSGRDSISEVASVLRVEGQVAPKEEVEPEKEEESSPLQLSDLKGFLEKRKVEKALSQLEKDEGDKKKNLETLRKYIEGEDIS